MTDTKIKIMKKLPLPIVIVNNQPLFIQEYLNRVELAKIFTNKNSLQIAETNLHTYAYQQLIYEKIISLLAKEKEIQVDSQELENGYKLFKEDFQKQTQKELEDILNDYKISANYFKENILKFQLLENKLIVWHNSQKELNTIAYNKISLIQSKLNQGVSFELLAKNYTENELEASLNGDLGYVNLSDLLLEVELEVKNLNPGDIKLVASSLGLHYIKVEARSEDNTKVHLLQIFIRPSEFNIWFEKEKQKFKIKQLFNF